MFRLTNSISSRLFSYHTFSILTKSFSSTIGATLQETNGKLQSFIQSIVEKKGIQIPMNENDSLSFQSYQKELLAKGVINETDASDISHVLSEFNSIVSSDSNPETILSQIKDNAFLSSFLVASKRSVSLADYCAYYLLYPLFSSISSPQSFDSLSSYYLRMQSNKEIRASSLAPPILQLKPKKQKSNQSSQNTPAFTPEECLSKLDIRVGKIMKAWNHPDSEKLICEQVDVGEEAWRSIGSGIRSFHKVEEMEGKLVCVLCNMKERKLAGYPSNGMLLCASTEDHSKGALIEPPPNAQVGEPILFEGIQRDPATPNQVSKKKMVETVLQYLKTNPEGVCCFKDIPFTTLEGVVTCKKFPNESIS